MTYPKQRQIVEVPFNLPDGVKNHPAIVLSKSDVIEQEYGAFIAVMITSTKREDEYTFVLYNEMLPTRQTYTEFKNK